MIKILDGGMLFELNKVYNDFGQTAVLNDKNLVRKIHEEYINMGCNLITTSNYGFKPNRMNNWKELTTKKLTDREMLRLRKVYYNP